MRFASRVAALSRRIFIAIFALSFALTLPLTLHAQEQVWLQIEARPTRSEATERAQAYNGLFSQTHGFRLPSGWYAIALGPYAPAEGAATLDMLKGENLIPRDSYVTDGREYRERFWPETDAVPLIISPSIAEPENDVSDAPEVAIPADPAIAEPATPEPAALPQETLAEARASEAQLSSAEKQELQLALQWFGFYQGGIDGAFGPGTRNSMAAWQAALGLDATGVLTSHQRSTLVANHQAEVAEYGFATVEERESGITLTLPLALVEFDRYEPPFVHFREKDGSGLSIVLISQPGDQGAFNGLYEILQTLEDLPPTGERRRTDKEFVIRGSSERRDTQVWAQFERGLIKGWMTVGTPAHAARDARALQVIAQSFRAIGDTALDPGLVPLDEAARRGLLAGLDVRKPKSSASGFYVTGKGAVLTSAAAVAQCGKITLDRQHDAQVTLIDDAAGYAVLTPTTPLAPSSVAIFQTAPARIGAEIAVAGYSYGDRLPAPVLTWGSLEDLTGLEGEPHLTRLAIGSRSGDAGGPVLDAAGAVIGMLLATPEAAARQLPAGAGFAANATSLSAALRAKGIPVTEGAETDLLAPEMLTRRATGMTVLVSCWD